MSFLPTYAGVLDLLPVVSWLWLRGKCRYCNKAIGIQYPMVEIMVALAFIGSYLAWPYDFDHKGMFLLATWLVSIVILTALLIYDIKWMILPNVLVFPLIAIAVIQVVSVATFFDGGAGTLLQACGGLAVAGGIFYVLFQLSGGNWIGGGDVKLGFALGLIVGTPLQGALVLFLAAVGGSVWSVPALLTKRLNRASKIPFGPFLIVATALVVLFGQSIVDWYLHDLLLLP